MSTLKKKLLTYEIKLLPCGIKNQWTTIIIFYPYCRIFKKSDDEIFQTGIPYLGENNEILCVEGKWMNKTISEQFVVTKVAFPVPMEFTDKYYSQNGYLQLFDMSFSM